MLDKLRRWAKRVDNNTKRSTEQLKNIEKDVRELKRLISAPIARGHSTASWTDPELEKAETNSASVVHAAIKGVWNDHNDEEYRKDQSHWRGVGRWVDDAAWQAIGRRSLTRFNRAWMLAGRSADELKDLTLLEWGPGGGTNAFALRDIASVFYGVDISEKNLSESQRMITAEGRPDYFHPILVQGEPSSVLPHVPTRLDGFLSTSVFQHFPSREYGKEVLAAIRAVCKSGAVGFIQIRFDNDNKRYKGIQALHEYEKNHIRATSYPLDSFWSLLSETGFTPLAIDGLADRNNQATFYMLAK
ncbi:methyltransferase domain-containing protein [Rhizobium rhizophilum]|uniref:Class I SAM-dependent methyltransferase n=1 Tax=Rhizobium rhizophilum TaxID=1850373 RepID=A0ABY2QN40_9HYPH|nr:methyltransferase domain-containing protein [Rhizobium rhizophilum]THV10587.1 class I SAM-dependent methyltransferase [Rhizobium rhizophilum]